jgi:D-serine deaminase-like pyridoxal phosphate-dependent protein
MLATPFLLVDLDAFDANAATLARIVIEGGAAWRPHVKAHKSPWLAARQMARGAVGVTCAKVGEAEVMVDGGITSVLVANQIVAPDALARLAQLQARAEVIACVDDVAQVDAANAAATAVDTVIPLLIEVDVGEHRAGVSAGPAARDLARQIAGRRGVRFAGLLGYEGHVNTLWPAEVRAAACRAALDPLVATRRLLEDDGIEVRIVSSGGSATADVAARVDGITEIQAGGACLMDRYYRELCHLNGYATALTVRVTVTSRPTRERFITDGGWKAMSNGVGGLPLVVAEPGLRIVELHAEHGIGEVESGSRGPVVGDTLDLIPGYSDATVFLHDWVVIGRAGQAIEVVPVAARGKLS